MPKSVNEKPSFELHIWGPLGNATSFLPECLAAVWYLELTVGSANVDVIQSSNQNIAKNRQLPALKHNGKVVAGGFQSVLWYLKNYGYDLDGDFKNGPALCSYMVTRVVPLTLYTLFVNRTNFDKLTSPLLSRLVPFPMQYNLTISQRDWAKAVCSDAGLIDAAPADWSLTNTTKNNPTLSKLQQQLEGKQEEANESLKGAHENLRALNVAKDVFQVLQGSFVALKNPNSANSPSQIFPFGGDEPTSADLILLANLIIACHEDLPVQIITTLIRDLFPQLDAFRTNGHDYISAKVGPIHTTSVPQEDSYSLVNWIKYYTGISTGWA